MDQLSLIRSKVDSGLWRQLDTKGSDSNEPIRVIVKVKDETISPLGEYCKPNQSDVLHRSFNNLGMFSAELCFNTIEQLCQHSSIEKIHYDQEVRVLLDKATPAIGSVAVKNQYGLTGKGITIAVVDTGVHPHPDLTKPNNRIIGFKDFIHGRANPYDDNGHGTHVAGCAAGNGYSSSGKYSAPAFEANVVGVKVLDAYGSGSYSTVLSGIDWVIQNRNTFSIKILNLSLGANPTTSYIDDPLAQAARKAWRSGIIVFAAAGNAGPNGPINTPGFDPLVITVGAIKDFETVDRSDDQYADYTSRGPTINGFIKPNLAVPGSNITSLLAPNSVLANQYPANIVGNHYFILSGTSMATPLCAGACAQFLQAYPNFGPDRVKGLLLSTAQFFGDPFPGYFIIYRTVHLTTIQ